MSGLAIGSTITEIERDSDGIRGKDGDRVVFDISTWDCFRRNQNRTYGCEVKLPDFFEKILVEYDYESDDSAEDSNDTMDWARSTLYLVSESQKIKLALFRNKKYYNTNNHITINGEIVFTI